jgi:Tfp pilus assembly major pilin PilA
MNNFWKNKNGSLLIGLVIVAGVMAILIEIILFNNKQQPGIVQRIPEAKDVAIKASMNTLTANGLLYSSSHGDYNGFCDDTSTRNVFNSIVSANKICNQNASEWAVCARLIEDPKTAWCVDYKGSRVQIDNNDCKDGFYACP